MPEIQGEFPPDQAQRDKAEGQILEHHRLVDYNTKEYPVEVIVDKYLNGLEKDENEFFVPDYQREHTWDPKRQSKFIESVLMGLPIPFLFVADIGDVVHGRVEIVDGSQRIRTLAAFSTNNLKLTGLEKLATLNGFCFRDLSLARQRKYNRTTLRLIELTDKADAEVRRDIFERINTGSDPLNDMEKRRGIMQGPFLDFLEECAKNLLFQKLAPINEADAKRREREEFVLRFFAYLERYEKFDRSVKDFLDEFVKEKNTLLAQNSSPASLRDPMLREFERMLAFVDDYFPFGFRKAQNHSTTPRIRFEAIAVGVALALRLNPRPSPIPADTWISSEVFRELTTSDASNSRPKVVRRIEYVRDKILGKSNP